MEPVGKTKLEASLVDFADEGSQKRDLEFENTTLKVQLNELRAHIKRWAEYAEIDEMPAEWVHGPDFRMCDDARPYPTEVVKGWRE